MRWDQIRFSIDFIVVIQRFDAVRSVCVARTAVQCSSQHRLQPAEMARRTVNVVGQLGLARRADRSAAYSLAIAASICSRTSRPCRAGPWLGHPKWSRKAHRAGSSRAATTTHKKCPPLEGASGSGRAFFRRFVYTLRGRRRAQGTHGDNPIVCRRGARGGARGAFVAQFYAESGWQAKCRGKEEIEPLRKPAR